jgi:hypothetical protein
LIQCHSSFSTSTSSVRIAVVRAFAEGERHAKSGACLGPPRTRIMPKAPADRHHRAELLSPGARRKEQVVDPPGRCGAAEVGTAGDQPRTL